MRNTVELKFPFMRIFLLESNVKYYIVSIANITEKKFRLPYRHTKALLVAIGLR